eukprot:365137-Chlamydomonas_euryale.AAC.3
MSYQAQSKLVPKRPGILTQKQGLISFWRDGMWQPEALKCTELDTDHPSRLPHPTQYTCVTRCSQSSSSVLRSGDSAASASLSACSAPFCRSDDAATAAVSAALRYRQSNEVGKKCGGPMTKGGRQEIKPWKRHMRCLLVWTGCWCGHAAEGLRQRGRHLHTL